MSLTYTWTKDGRAVYHTRTLSTGHAFTVMGQGLRQRSTGIHGRIDLLMDGVRLAWSYFNVERDEERVRLGNSAFKQLTPEDQKALPEKEMKWLLSSFCADVWDQWAGQYQAEEETGDEDIQPVTYALEPYILEEGGTICFAPPGAGKSWMGLLMAVSVDAGVDVIWPCRQRKVIFVNLERPRRWVRRRLSMVNLCLGLSATRPLLMLHARGRSLTDIEEGLRKSVSNSAAGLVVLDSISRSGLGDLKEDRAANAIIDCLNRLAPAWFAIGHSPRKDATHLFGSVHFEAGEDIGLRLLTERGKNGTLGIGLDMVKANDVAIAPLSAYALEFDNFGLSNARFAKRHEFPEIDAGRQMGSKDLLMEHLLATGEQTAADAADALGLARPTVSSLLNSNTCFQKRRDGHRVLYSIPTQEEGY